LAKVPLIGADEFDSTWSSSPLRIPHAALTIDSSPSGEVSAATAELVVSELFTRDPTPQGTGVVPSGWVALEASTCDDVEAKVSPSKRER